MSQKEKKTRLAKKEHVFDLGFDIQCAANRGTVLQIGHSYRADSFWCASLVSVSWEVNSINVFCRGRLLMTSGYADIFYNYTPSSY